MAVRRRTKTFISEVFSLDGRNLINDWDMKVNSCLFIKSCKQRMKGQDWDIILEVKKHQLGLEFYEIFNVWLNSMIYSLPISEQVMITKFKSYLLLERHHRSLFKDSLG